MSDNTFLVDCIFNYLWNYYIPNELPQDEGWLAVECLLGCEIGWEFGLDAYDPKEKEQWGFNPDDEWSDELWEERNKFEQSTAMMFRKIIFAANSIINGNSCLWNVPADKEGFKQYIKDTLYEWYYEK